MKAGSFHRRIIEQKNAAKKKRTKDNEGRTSMNAA